MKTISIIALKGGVGKTVTAVNLADNLAERGYRVCLIDADPQANSTRFWGCKPELAGTYEIMSGGITEGFTEVPQHTANRELDLVSADLSLFALDAAALTNGTQGQINALANFRDNREIRLLYDFLIIDCPPGFTAASIAAIAASDLLVVPTALDAFAMQGLTSLNSQVEHLHRKGNSPVVLKCLITKYDKSEATQQAETMLRGSGFKTFETTIRTSHPIVTESTYEGTPLNQYSKWCSAARDYRAFTDELLETEGM
jgi:chromosome partitioning protein